MKIDAFIVYTDSETYGPTIHPQVALEQYRKHSGIDAKLIVVGMAFGLLCWVGGVGWFGVVECRWGRLAMTFLLITRTRRGNDEDFG